MTEPNLRGRLRWHRIVGYFVVGLLLLHPLLMVARRFWVQESEPLVNLGLLLGAPSLRPALVARVLLVLIVVLALVRRRFRARTWRYLHGALSAGVAGFATWHVLAVGRHSDATLSTYLIALAAGALIGLLRTYPAVIRKAMSKRTRRALA